MTRQVKSDSAVQKEFRHLSERVDAMAADIRQIAVAMKGDPTVGIPGIVPRIAAIEATLAGANLMASSQEVIRLRAEVDAMNKAAAATEKAASYNAGKAHVITACVSTAVAAFISIIVGLTIAKFSSPSYVQSQPASVVVQPNVK